jgi:cellobiose phosphorylase
MKYGYFDDDKREYVITTPETPLPWINYLGNDGMFGLISNTGGGYAFYKDARLRRLTRYRYNNIPLDSNGRYFYISEGDSFWSPTWQPIRKSVDDYRCRHGMGYTVIESKNDGLKAELTYLIPLNETVEVCRVTLTNESDRPRTFKLFSYLEFCLWNADQDDRNFQRNLNIGEVEVDGSTIYHKTEFRERRNHYSYYSVNRDVQSFDTSRDAFVGLYNGLESPQAVSNGECSNSMASGWAPIAAHCLQVDLAPGESDEFVFSLGYVEVDDDEKFQAPGIINKRPATDQRDRVSAPGYVDDAQNELAVYWTDLLGGYQIECADDKLSRMVNIWNAYQCMVTFNMSRSASYFESGIGRGMGFRDSNQDLLGFVHMVPERARERILDIAATQMSDGSAYHQYQPLTKQGNAEIGGNFNDDPLWLILGVCAYIRETGDAGILKESCPYSDTPDVAATLFDHLRQSFEFTLNNLGPHGLPLIGRADWNDCLNLNCFSTDPDEGFQTADNRVGKTAESLMIAGLFVYAGRELVDLIKYLGRPGDAWLVSRGIDQMVEAINTHGREPDWFLRAYDFNGDKVGSPENDDGRIYVESQGWCIMAGIGTDDGFARKSLDSVKTHLDTEHGVVLQDPPYRDYHLELGEVSSYPPGYKENGGIFCHTNPWIMIAEAMLGNGDAAFDYYSKICPAYREDISDLHRCEPYVYAQMIAGKAAAHFGEAKNSWLTGTASWNYVAITQYILGVRAGFNGLIVDPCLPNDMDELTISRIYRDCKYSITVRKATSGEEPGLLVNGERFAGKEIPAGGDTVDVLVLR